MTITRFIACLILSIVIFSVFGKHIAEAKIGVGVGTGKIVVDEPLRPGSISELPPLSIINTGTVTTTYRVNVTYHDQQTELQPPVEWFSFSPQEFTLEEGQASLVTTTVSVPVNTPPGTYFAFIEGQPLSSGESGSTAVGIAAATKLYFTVEPANILMAIWYRIIAILNVLSPWPQLALGVGGIVLMVMAVRRFVKVDIQLKNK